MPKSKAIISIENVVASAALNQKVDLNAVVKSFPGVVYRPEQFPGLVFRLKKPKTATLIFNSGKMVCTGAKSEKESRRAVMTVVKELKKGGIIIISKPELKIQNIVACISFTEAWRNKTSYSTNNIPHRSKVEHACIRKQWKVFYPSSSETMVIKI